MAVTRDINIYIAYDAYGHDIHFDFRYSATLFSRTDYLWLHPHGVLLPCLLALLNRYMNMCNLTESLKFSSRVSSSMHTTQMLLASQRFIL